MKNEHKNSTIWRNTYNLEYYVLYVHLIWLDDYILLNIRASSTCPLNSGEHWNRTIFVLQMTMLGFCTCCYTDNHLYKVNNFIEHLHPYLLILSIMVSFGRQKGYSCCCFFFKFLIIFQLCNNVVKWNRCACYKNCISPVTPNLPVVFSP